MKMSKVILLSLWVFLEVFVQVYVTATDKRSAGYSLTCTSPCQDADASGVSGPALPPCVITPNCWDRTTVPANQAPGAPRDVGLVSSPVLAGDGKFYLEMSPKWRPSTDRIDLLTGFEVKVHCSMNLCASQSFCVRVEFNRTLTTEDINSNFSVNCLYGNFSQPSMNYITMIRSLPKSNDETSYGSNMATLPSCKEVPKVALCMMDSPKDWIPNYRPFVSQISNGSVIVTFWPSESYPGYEIYLLSDPNNPSAKPQFFRYYDTKNASGPFVYFNDVPEGNYSAMVSIDQEYCYYDCSYFLSSNRITVHAPPTNEPSTHAQGSQPPPEEPREVSIPDSTGSPISLAAIAGGLGGILGVVLILILIARTRRRSSSTNGRGDSRHADDLYKTSMIQPNNMPHDDADSITGTGLLNDWPPMNGGMDSSLYGICNPSMIQPIIANGWKHDHDRLVMESDNYAKAISQQRGDSISKIAVDIHSSMDQHMSVRGNLPPIELPDSGVESVYSESPVDLDDERTLFSIALTNLGEEV